MLAELTKAPINKLRSANRPFKVKRRSHKHLSFQQVNLMFASIFVSRHNDFHHLYLEITFHGLSTLPFQ